MSSLPSFVQLMSSLGLDEHTGPSSPPSSPVITYQSRSVSRDHVHPSRRIARYSPYLPALLAARRGSLPAAPLITTEFHQPTRASSTSPRLLSRRRNTSDIPTNDYGSTSDLTANTPISIYVRRKMPSPSPTSPTFPHDDSPTSPMPFSLPTLPCLFPQTDSYSAPPTPESDIQPPTEHSSHRAKFLSEFSEAELHNPRFYRYTSVRISTPTNMNDRHGQLTQVE